MSSDSRGPVLDEERLGVVRFFLKGGFIVAPVVALGALYALLDPFRVVFSYPDYFREMRVQLNRGYGSVEVFKANDATLRYDSFIFGSSRTLALDTYDWRSYLQPTASPFHFDASGENIYGIRSKVFYLHSRGSRLTNAVLLIDPEPKYWSTAPRTGHLFFPHYELTGQSALASHRVFFEAFLNPRFLIRLLGYEVSGTVRPWMTPYIDARTTVFDPRTNDIWLVSVEDEIARTGEQYWTSRSGVFYVRPEKPEPYHPQITGDIEQNLREVANVFGEHRTELRVIISPLFNQRALAERDVELLRSIFCGSSVFDFSGVNEITSDKHNYYEESHFRPFVGRQMLREAYATGW